MLCVFVLCVCVCVVYVMLLRLRNKLSRYAFACLLMSNHVPFPYYLLTCDWFPVVPPIALSGQFDFSSSTVQWTLSISHQYFSKEIYAKTNAELLRLDDLVDDLWFTYCTNLEVSNRVLNVSLLASLHARTHYVFWWHLKLYLFVLRLGFFVCVWT